MDMTLRSCIFASTSEVWGFQPFISNGWRPTEYNKTHTCYACMYCIYTLDGYTLFLDSSWWLIIIIFTSIEYHSHCPPPTHTHKHKIQFVVTRVCDSFNLIYQTVSVVDYLLSLLKRTSKEETKLRWDVEKGGDISINDWMESWTNLPGYSVHCIQ